jgi:PKD repeat protein
MRYRFAWLVVLCALICPGKLLAATGQARLDLVEISGDRVIVRFTIENNGAENLRVLKWHTPLRGFSGRILEVLRDDQPVPYVGIIASRLAPTPKSYLVLSPGASHSVDFDLAEQYVLEGAGIYSVRWKGSGTARYIEGATEGWAPSPVLEFYYEGVSRQAIDRLVPELRPSTGDEASGSGYVWDDCSSARKVELTEALDYAEDLAAESYGHIKATPKASRPYEERYRRWFGLYTAKRWDSVKDSFKDIRDALRDPRDYFFGIRVEIDCKNAIRPVGCEEGWLAFVVPNRPEINLCPWFWNGGRDEDGNYYPPPPTTGTHTQSKASTLLHEMSHFNVVAGTDDACYGPTLDEPGPRDDEPGCLWLALHSPPSATDAADSYTSFAERPCTRPAAPTGLVATAASSSQVNLSWNPSPWLHTVMRATAAAGPYEFVSQTSSSSASSFTDTGRTCGTTYYYVVTARSSSLCSSALSAPAQATPPCGTPPTANFTFSTSGLAANFVDASTDTDGTIVSRVWDFGDGTSSTGVNATRVYAAPGTYQVRLFVTDSQGLGGSVTKPVTVGGSPPTANFTFTTNGLFVSFTDTSTDSDGTIVSRLWSFGDGDTSTTTNPSGSYAAPGTYQVTLTVTDNHGLTDSITKSVTVAAAACDGTVYSGTLSAGQFAFVPNGEGYTSNTPGNHRGTLTSPAGADFGLSLQKLNGVQWVTVAIDDSNGVASYDGTAGNYRWIVAAGSGSGSYSLCIKSPP